MISKEAKHKKLRRIRFSVCKSSPSQSYSRLYWKNTDFKTWELINITASSISALCVKLHLMNRHCNSCNFWAIWKCNIEESNTTSIVERHVSKKKGSKDFIEQTSWEQLHISYPKVVGYLTKHFWMWIENGSYGHSIKGSNIISAFSFNYFSQSKGFLRLQFSVGNEILSLKM